MLYPAALNQPRKCPSSSACMGSLWVLWFTYSHRSINKQMNVIDTIEMSYPVGCMYMCMFVIPTGMCTKLRLYLIYLQRGRSVILLMMSYFIYWLVPILFQCVYTCKLQAMSIRSADLVRKYGRDKTKCKPHLNGARKRSLMSFKV